jgi:hypothetical protein
MTTIENIATKRGVSTDAVKKQIKRKQLGNFSPTETLPKTVLTALYGSHSLAPIPKPKEPKRKEAIPKPKQKTKSHNFVKLLQVLPLPMLGAAASYGVYYFAAQFVPFPVAIFEAAAFELTYIGLASMKGLSDRQSKYAQRVAIGAVIVSVIYNTLAGAIHQDETILKDLSGFYFWLIAIVHGAPLAILAYFVSDLIFKDRRK